MYSRISILAMALAICHAFPQHSYGGGFGHSYSDFKGFEGYEEQKGGEIEHAIQYDQAPIVHKVAVPVVHKVAVPVVHKVAVPIHKEEKIIDYYAPPHYQFKYGVKDEKTGDIKEQHEERDGDVTKGYYSLHEPDGTERIVHYTVDKHSGFQAVVEKKGKAYHPEQIQHHEPLVYHKAIAPVYHKAIEVAPVYHKAIAPVYHKAIEVAPVYHKSYGKYY